MPFGDLSGIVSNAGVALEQQALKQFGAAVGSATSGALNGFFGSPTTASAPAGTGSNPASQEVGVYDTTRYAAALVKPDQVDFNPKQKFLFKVSFKFNPSMIDAARMLGYDLTKIEQNAGFMIRHVDRPKFDYEYEDVNMYNFRTKVLKTIRHREVSFTLYDDVGNNVLSFVNIYRKLQQPITRMQQSPSAAMGDNGFNFDKTLTALDTSFRGPLPGDRINILDSMTIHQIFVERGSHNVQSLVKSVDFVFINPRFTNIDVDDMDHENGANFNLITIASDFDTMFMNEPKAFTQSTGASFPTGDIPFAGSGSSSQAGGANNPLVNIIANQTSMSSLSGLSDVSSLINKTLSTTAGGALNGVLSGGLNQVTGIVGNYAKNTLSTATAGLTSAFSRGISAPVIDDSVAPSQVADLSSVDYQATRDN